MAILIHGIPCQICGEGVYPDVQEVVCFPAFVADPHDPFHFFSDACFHRACFERHPLGQRALERLCKLPRYPLEDSRDDWRQRPTPRSSAHC